jgi:hypothetical protein
MYIARCVTLRRITELLPLRRLRRLALRDMPTLRRRIASLTGFLVPARRQPYLVM